MNTKPINPQQKQTVVTGAPHTDKKVNPKVVAGAAAGAAVIGVGGTAAAMALNSDGKTEEEALDPDAQAQEVEIGNNEDFNPDAPISGGLGSIFGNAPATESTSSAASTAQPHHQPSSTQHHHHQASAAQAPASRPEQPADHTSEPEQIPEPEPISPEEQEIITPIGADEILAINEIDADDNDIPELLSFESVELVPDEDGTVQIQASFSMEGESYTMIDVDNDGVFDAVADAAGNNQGSAAGMMLSDIELINNVNNDDYLAANGYDNNSEMSQTGESSVDDTLTV